MGKVFGIALGMGLLFLLIVFGTLKLPSPVSHGAMVLEKVHAPQAVLVSVPKLSADYQTDKVAADARYKGKRLFVEGQVASINKGAFDGELVLLSTFGEFKAVHADIRAEYQSEAAKLRTGQVITVDCEGGGLVMGDPLLMNCSIQPNASVVQGDSRSPETHIIVPTLNSTAPATYSAEARQNKLQGTVEIRLLVDKNGDPQNVMVVRSLGMGLDESAVEAVKHYKFKPAVDESTGKVVTARMSIGLQFHLN